MPLGALLAGVAFLLDLPLAGGLGAACALPLAFFVALDFAGFSSGFAASPSPWMRSQMRLAAALGVLKRSTGSTPGRVFQRATRRSAGQPTSSSASSFWLAKESKGVVVAAAASSAEANAVMLFSLSIVYVVIIVLLGATLCAVMTWIAPKRLKSKAIVQGIDDGDGVAMVVGDR